MKRFAVLSFCTLALLSETEASPLLDDLVLGDMAAETAHQLKAEKSELMRGALELPARRLMPGGSRRGKVGD